MIELKGICKSFKVAKRDSGFGNAFKALFKREYETLHALDNVSFTISEGETVGYIGPNGAGKSTTIKIMCGILNPDAGSCTINNFIPYKDRKEYVRNIGVVFGQRSQLWWDVPVIDSFMLLKDIYKIDEKPFKNTLEELTYSLQLREILKTPVRTLSLGQRMRCEIAASLLHGPKILFLDEPTIGLDAVSKIAVRSFIKNLNKSQNTTVILTTHDMQDIEAIADRIILIGKGKILLDGNLHALKNKFAESKTVKIHHSTEFSAFDGICINESTKGYSVVTIDESILSLSNAISKIASLTEILNISTESISAEEMVVKMYKEFEI